MKDMGEVVGHDSVILSNLEDEMKDLLASLDHDTDDDDVFDKRLDSIGSQRISKNKCNGNHQHKLEEDKLFEKFIFENEEKIGENDFLNLFGELKLAEPKMEAKSAESESYNNFGADYLNKNNNCAPKENMSTSSLHDQDRKVSSTSIVLKRNTTSSSDMVTSSRRGGDKFNPSLAMQQIRQKHHGILAARLEKIQNRSAPTSPTTRKKYSTLPANSRLHSSSSQHRGRSTQRSVSVSSDGRGHSPEERMAADQYAHHMRSLSCSSSAIPSHGGINKASSMRSLQLGRPRRLGGSNLSLLSLDSAHEEELKEEYVEARSGRIKEQKVAELEKARLHNIMNMCAELMKKTDEDFPSDRVVATPVMMTSSTTAATGGSNYRRLTSFEDDIMRESKAAKHQHQQQVDNSVVTSHMMPDDVTRGHVAAGDVTTEATAVTKKLRTPRRMADVEEIRRLRDESLNKVDDIQQRIGHLEEQISECATGAEMEKALMLGELSCERKLLVAEERKCDEIKDRIIQLEERYIEQREKQQTIVSREKERLIEMENTVSTIKTQIDKCPESLRGSMEEKLNEKEEALEEENRNFEDAEFQAFEILSKLDENKEERQRELIGEKKIMENNISGRKTRIELLEQQIGELGEQHQHENQRLNMDRDQMIGNLQEQRKETILLEDKHYQMTGEYPGQKQLSPPQPSYQQATMTSSSFHPSSSSKTNHSMTSPSKCGGGGGDLDHALGTGDEGGLGSPTASVATTRSNDVTTSPNLKQLEMSKQQQQQASPEIRQMRMKQTNQQHQQPPSGSNRVLHLPPTSALHRPNHYQPLHHHANQYSPTTEQRWNDCISIGSMDSLDTSLSNWSVSNVDSLERVRQMERLIEDATAEKQRLLAEVQQQQRDASTPSTSAPHQRAPNNEEERDVMTSPSSTPDTSSNSVRMRHASGNSNERRQIRPMTRYLPVLSQDFDLRRHIEGCGHSPSTSMHATLTHDSCRGYLTKMGGRVKSWKRRWFVFDRHSKLLKYFKNKHEIKKRGEIPFLNIENVFFDHLKTHKSPDPTLTFCIKCLHRIYFMVAPSSESMRIWMDVIMTGAMGHAYQKTYE